MSLQDAWEEQAAHVGVWWQGQRAGRPTGVASTGSLEHLCACAGSHCLMTVLHGTPLVCAACLSQKLTFTTENQSPSHSHCRHSRHAAG